MDGSSYPPTVPHNFGFAIVGCGVIAPRHARAIEDLPDARLAAAVDARPEAAASFGAEFGCDHTSELDRVLDRADVDVVCVCAPNGLHAEIGVRAAEAGKHVVVEKPIEVSLPATDRLITACRTAGVGLTVIYPRRFTPAGRQLRELVDSGRLGRLVLGDTVVKLYRGRAYWDSGTWRGSTELDGGTLINQGVHALDLLQWIMGPVEKVAGQVTTAVHDIAAPDIELGVLTFASGAVGMIEGTTVAYPGLCDRLEITGTGGTIVMDRGRILACELTDERSDLPAHGARINPLPPNGNDTPNHHAHRAQLADFLESIRDGREPAVTGADGRRAIEIVTALHESARTGREVTVPCMATG